jgi:hypothetical protein
MLNMGVSKNYLYIGTRNEKQLLMFYFLSLNLFLTLYPSCFDKKSIVFTRVANTEFSVWFYYRFTMHMYCINVYL